MPVDTSGNPPKGYVTVQDALDLPVGTYVNVIGVVVDIWEPMSTKGSDMLLTFRIRDKSVSAMTDRDKLKVRRFFPKNSTDQPRVQNGDLVILRDIRLTDSNFGRIALFNFKTELVVFPASKIPAPHFNDEFASGMRKVPHESSLRHKPPTSAEQLYAIALHHACGRNDEQQVTQFEAHGNSRRIIHVAPSAPTAPMASARNKFQLLSGCEENKFYDVVVEVVKKFSSNYDRCEIYATDYTENLRFYDYSKERGGVDGDPLNYTDPGFGNSWKGPHGQRTIQILLFEPHASHCLRSISERDLVFIRNLRIKSDKNGCKLEGVLHQDRVYTDRVDIFIPKQLDERMAALMSRRDEYWKKFGYPPAEQETRKQRRKERRKAQKERQRAQKEQEAVESESDVPQAGCNSYVVTERTEASPTCLADILENAHYNFKTPAGVACKLPFINAKFRTQVRVVDFYPRNLEDFSRSLDDPTYNDVPPESQRSGLHTDFSASPPRWEWAFYLLVEDAKQTDKSPKRIPLLVANRDAEYLLNMGATDLGCHPKALRQLKDKLFALWGNLEELKAEMGEDADVFDVDMRNRHQSKPFECLVKQYGVEVPHEEDGEESLGYHRMFRMFGTTIK